jgi:hypothetical protein
MVLTSLVPHKKNLAKVLPSLGQVTSSLAPRIIVTNMGAASDISISGLNAALVAKRSASETASSLDTTSELAVLSSFEINLYMFGFATAEVPTIQKANQSTAYTKCLDFLGSIG